jgi:LPXTG-motif cell wall-anchored protein
MCPACLTTAALVAAGAASAGGLTGFLFRRRRLDAPGGAFRHEGPTGNASDPRSDHPSNHENTGSNRHE